MPRTHSISLKLTADEHEWLRRKAYWDGTSMSEIVRTLLNELITQQGYLRPPDDEAQDFGYEKEQMQFVLKVQNAGE